MGNLNKEKKKYKKVNFSIYQEFKKHLRKISMFLMKKKLSKVDTEIDNAFSEGQTLDEILERIKIALDAVDDELRNESSIRENYLYVRAILNNKRPPMPKDKIMFIIFFIFVIAFFGMIG